MADDRVPIRSYQRIFRPDRRLYQVEGHRLPVPGGVPLRWLGYAIATVISVLVLSGRSPVLSVLLALGAGAYGLAVGGAPAGALAGASVAAGSQVIGLLVGVLDWPLRLLVVPSLVATLATQATPDGRPAHRYALSRVRLWLSPLRRSVGRSLPGAGERQRVSGELWVASDQHSPLLRRGRVHGRAVARFAAPMLVARRRLARGRFRARPVTAGRRARRRGSVVDSVELGAGEVLEVRR